jgi:uncharacterized protein
MGWFESFWTALAVLVGGYVVLAALVTLLQRNLIYKPDPRRTTPEDAGHSGVDVWHVQVAHPPEPVLEPRRRAKAPATSGEKLVAWYARAEPGRPTILYFHGNAGYIELRSLRLAELQARGFGVLMPSYRGYGGSSGRPSEAANIADALKVYDLLLAQGVATRDVVLFGESLGTGIATQLAAAKRVSGLVLDSPYTSMADLAARDYPWLPVRQLLWDHYETIHHIKRVTSPLLVLHGEADQLVPVEMGRAVSQAAAGKSTLLTYPDAAHLDHLAHGSFDDVERWIMRSRLYERTRPHEKSPRRTPGLIKPLISKV